MPPKAPKTAYRELKQEILCDRESCSHINEDGECVRYRIQIDEDGLCIDYEDKRYDK